MMKHTTFLLTVAISLGSTPAFAQSLYCGSDDDTDQLVGQLHVLGGTSLNCAGAGPLDAADSRSGPEDQINQVDLILAIKNAIRSCSPTESIRGINHCRRIIDSGNGLIDALTSDPQNKAQTERARRRLIDALQRHDPGLTPYRHNYAVLGNKPFEMKFQFSLQYKLFYDTSGVGGNFFRDTIASRLYFTFSQESFWALEQESAPFRDINFRPQLVYVVPGRSLESGVTRQWWGIEHESNGRDGPDSRGWNRVFGRLEYTYGNWRLLPEVWADFAVADENADIRDFYGNVGLGIRYDAVDPSKRLFGHQFAADYRQGREKGGLEASWSFKVSAIAEDLLPVHFDPYIHIRYWHGYGENLLTYNEKSSSLRLGLSFALD